MRSPMQPAPPPTRRGWGAGLAIIVLGLLGAFLGMVAVVAIWPTDSAIIGVLALAGMWLGLCGGIWFGFSVTNPNRRR